MFKGVKLAFFVLFFLYRLYHLLFHISGYNNNILFVDSHSNANKLIGYHDNIMCLILHSNVKKSIDYYTDQKEKRDKRRFIYFLNEVNIFQVI